MNGYLSVRVCPSLLCWGGVYRIGLDRLIWTIVGRHTFAFRIFLLSSCGFWSGWKKAPQANGSQFKSLCYHHQTSLFGVNWYSLDDKPWWWNPVKKIPICADITELGAIFNHVEISSIICWQKRRLYQRLGWSMNGWDAIVQKCAVRL